jgi:hypothetical protein
MKRWIVLMLLANGIAGWAAAYTRYQVLDLTDMGNGSPIVPAYGYAINDAGQITGHGTPTVSGATSKVYLYNSVTGVFINVGNLLGNFVEGYGGNGYSINQQGIIVGRNSISNTSYDYRPFLFYDANSNGLVDPNELQNLGIEAGDDYGIANDINDRNQVVGYGVDLNDVWNGWVWTDGDQDLQYDAGEKQYFNGRVAMSINNSGQIVMTGSSQTILWGDPNEDGIYSEDEKQTLPLPSGYLSISGTLINNPGAIGGSVKNGNSKTNLLYWNDDDQDGVVEEQEYTIVGSMLWNTFARAMNNQGEIVGGTYELINIQRMAYIWTREEGMANLNDLAGYTDATLGPAIFSQAEAINDRGIILTNGFFDLNHDGKRSGSEPEHAFVLIPCWDISMDCVVNLEDFNILMEHYGFTDCTSENTYCDRTDLSQDGQVSLDDLAQLAEDWLMTYTLTIQGN